REIGVGRVGREHGIRLRVREIIGRQLLERRDQRGRGGRGDRRQPHGTLAVHRCKTEQALVLRRREPRSDRPPARRGQDRSGGGEAQDRAGGRAGGAGRDDAVVVRRAQHQPGQGDRDRHVGRAGGERQGGGGRRARGQGGL